MNSGIPTNQKVGAVSRDDWDRQSEGLIELAKGSPKIQELLVKALVNPSRNLAPPIVKTGRLLRAFKVADVAGSTIHSKRGDESAFDRWRWIRESLLGRLRGQAQLALLSRCDVRELGLCLKQLQPWWGDVTGIDSERIEEDLKVLEDTAKEYASFPKSPPRRGRRLTEHQKRIIAAVELLR